MQAEGARALAEALRVSTSMTEVFMCGVSLFALGFNSFDVPLFFVHPFNGGERVPWFSCTCPTTFFLPLLLRPIRLMTEIQREGLPPSPHRRTYHHRCTPTPMRYCRLAAYMTRPSPSHIPVYVLALIPNRVGGHTAIGWGTFFSGGQ